VALLVAFLASGSTAKTGPFRLHIQRLVTFLKSGVPHGAPEERRKLVEKILASAEAGAPLKAESPERMLNLLASPKKPGEEAWKELENECAKLF
jgi:hypothetical protein